MREYDAYKELAKMLHSEADYLYKVSLDIEVSKDEMIDLADLAASKGCTIQEYVQSLVFELAMGNPNLSKWHKKFETDNNIISVLGSVEQIDEFLNLCDQLKYQLQIMMFANAESDFTKMQENLKSIIGQISEMLPEELGVTNPNIFDEVEKVKRWRNEKMKYVK